MQVIGHRGARAVEPENTLRAVREGMRCADTIEVDLRRTRDGVLVVIHDATLDRTTDGHGPVGTLSLAALQHLDAGKGEKIPTFSEVLDLVDGRCGLFAEIKEPGTEESACILIGESGIREVTIVSFHASSIKRVAEYADIRTGLIVSGTTAGAADVARDLGAEVLLPRFSLVTPSFVTEAHRVGLSLVAWTVDDDADIRRALDLGIDGIATDNPCHTRDVIDRSTG